MNRRSFLKLLGAAGPVAAVVPTYFFAPVGGWKSDVIVNPFASPPWMDGDQIIGDRMYYIGRLGIYENGTLISSAVDPEAFLPGPNERFNNALQLIDDYMKRARHGMPA